LAAGTPCVVTLRGAAAGCLFPLSMWPVAAVAGAMGRSRLGCGCGMATRAAGAVAAAGADGAGGNGRGVLRAMPLASLDDWHGGAGSSFLIAAACAAGAGGACRRSNASCSGRLAMSPRTAGSGCALAFEPCTACRQCPCSSRQGAAVAMSYCTSAYGPGQCGRLMHSVLPAALDAPQFGRTHLGRASQRAALCARLVQLLARQLQLLGQ
jgi:hypothetical protein